MSKMNKFGEGLTNKRGVILITAFMIIAVLLVVSNVFISSVITDKRDADQEKINLQALFLGEAGASHGLSELKKRIDTDLPSRLRTVRVGRQIRRYVETEDSLGFLRDYAYGVGETRFSVEDNAASLLLANLDLNSSIPGDYEVKILIFKNGQPRILREDVYEFGYKYSIESKANVFERTPSTEKRVVFYGDFVVIAQRANFARYALFTNHHFSPSGITVWFTNRTNFRGPVATNDRFSFALNPSGTFTEEVTQHLTKARFYNNGWPILLDADRNRDRDVPIFEKEFERGVDVINLESALRSEDLKSQALGSWREPGRVGIYIPNNGTQLTGGIYIRGDASIQLGVDLQNNAVFTIRQGRTLKRIIIDYQAQQTTVVEGSRSTTYEGLPDGVDGEGIIIYTKGNVDSLAGTVQRDTQLTVSSERDIVITDNILYQDYNLGPPLNAEGYNNLLGILSWGGDVRIGRSAPNDVSIHGVVMAAHGVFTVDNYRFGRPRGTATLLGGVITDFYGPFGTFRGSRQISGYGRNFIYDGRMLEGFSPPYFPTQRNFTSSSQGLDERPLWRQFYEGQFRWE